MVNVWGKRSPWVDCAAEVDGEQLADGQRISFRWRVVIHPGDAESGKVADLYQAFAGKPQSQAETYAT